MLSSRFTPTMKRISLELTYFFWEVLVYMYICVALYRIMKLTKRFCVMYVCSMMLANDCYLLVRTSIVCWCEVR